MTKASNFNLTASSHTFSPCLQSASELPDDYSAGFILPTLINSCQSLWPCAILDPWTGHSLYVQILGKFVKQIHIFARHIPPDLNQEQLAFPRFY